MDDSDPLNGSRLRPTASRPLLGLTVLVVEDSRFACEAMRLLCLRSGARIRRADCLRSARRHLQVYRPAIVVIDLGLPDGSGTELIQELAQAQQSVEVLLGTSGDPDGEQLALAAGADGFLAKPITSLSTFQETILRSLPPDRHPPAPRVLPDDTITPDPLAFQDDMAHVADVLSAGIDDKSLDYVAQFVGGVARSAKDDTLAAAADALARARADGRPITQNAAQIAGMVQDRLQQKRAI